MHGICLNPSMYLVHSDADLNMEDFKWEGIQMSLNFSLMFKSLITHFKYLNNGDFKWEVLREETNSSCILEFNSNGRIQWIKYGQTLGPQVNETH